MYSIATNAAKFALNNGPTIFFLVQNTVTHANNFRNWIYKRLEQNNQCPVCNQEIVDNDTNLDNIRIKLPICGHSYHLRCLNYMREIQSICAICEKDIIPNGLSEDNSNSDNVSNKTENGNLNIDSNQTESNGLDIIPNEPPSGPEDNSNSENFFK